MATYSTKNRESKGRTTVNDLSHLGNGNASTFQFEDNRTDRSTQDQLQGFADSSHNVQRLQTFQQIADSSPQSQRTAQLQAVAGDTPGPVQRTENRTGLPHNLKTSIEQLSGFSMDDTKVHYNSNRPAQLQAHAYAQGSDIHIGPGQQKHLAHEAWHVVQQKQDRVRPLRQMKGGISINDDTSLEREADQMGAKAMQMASSLGSYQEPTTQLKCKDCENDQGAKKKKVLQPVLQRVYNNCKESTHHSSIEEKSIVIVYNKEVNKNSAVGEMALDNSGSWMFADLVDEKAEEVYEIKTVHTGKAKATEEAKIYKSLLNSNCVGNWTLGTAFGEETVDMGFFNMKFSSPGSGAILYELVAK